MECRYNQKGKHNRRSTCGGVESFKNYGPWSISVTKPNQDAYFDGTNLTRSKIMNENMRLQYCNHSIPEYTKKETFKNGRLRKVTVNLSESHWNEDRNNKRIRRGTKLVTIVEYNIGTIM